MIRLNRNKANVTLFTWFIFPAPSHHALLLSTSEGKTRVFLLHRNFDNYVMYFKRSLKKDESIKTARSNEAIDSVVSKELILFSLQSVLIFHMLFYFNFNFFCKRERVSNAILYLFFLLDYFLSVSCIFICFASLVIIFIFPYFGENGK